MSKWAIWTAHRYLEYAAAPRRARADGRPLQRAWRAPSPTARAEAVRTRAARRQARWPRLVGFALMGVAVMVALEPVQTFGADRRAWAPSGTDLGADGFAAVAPVGAVAGAALVEFRWRAAAVAPPFTFVLLDGAYTELARRDGIGDTRLPIDGGLATLLAPGQLRHWYVLGDRAGKPAATALVRVEIR